CGGAGHSPGPRRLCLELRLEAGERTRQRGAHLRADEEEIGGPREEARVAQRVGELLVAPRPLGDRLEDGEELALSLRVGELDSVPDPRLVLDDALRHLPPPGAARAPAERPADLRAAVGL